MWILDTSVERDRVAFWGPGGVVERASYPPSFLLTLTDPVAHWELVEALDVEYGAAPVTVRTIHSDRPGWRINAGKDVAAKRGDQSEMVEESDDVSEVDATVAIVVERRQWFVSRDPGYLVEVQDDPSPAHGTIRRS